MNTIDINKIKSSGEAGVYDQYPSGARSNHRVGTMRGAVKFSVLILFTLFSMGCSTPVLVTPTIAPSATSTSTSTPIPTETATVTPTKTPIPTRTSLVKLGETHVINEAGFSVRVPIGYASQVEARQIVIANLERTLIISFAGIESPSSEEQVVDEYLDAVARRSDGEFIKTPSDPVSLSGFDGKSFDLTGSLVGNPLQGKTLIVPISENHCFYALAIANISEDESAWEDQGIKVFEAILESVEFFEPENTGTCPIATDDTYGYTKENAIRVGDGGELFGGPTQERAYLDNLRGPNGELISYERTGSLNFEDTILDEYVISGLGSPVTLYLDIYKFEELKAPVGFMCAGPFNLQP